MRKEDILTGNSIIAEFLQWHQINESSSDKYIPMYKVPANINDDFCEKYVDVSVEEFLFDSDWNWFMHCWNFLHRSILVPIAKDNPHMRREVNDFIKDTRNCLKWCHIEGAYKMLVKILTWYNNQFE